ncbi:MFS general substrate transporter [Ascodesmis nigricans]|uniref:MFS general substrate transporter n=1 Tax=Ascodesmis nigricans TaxID=341454 RepID=A0A4S2MQQ6_9PEZI|nr:MFS general substrate transporter [Ascodesmis nigricans]
MDYEKGTSSTPAPGHVQTTPTDLPILSSSVSHTEPPHHVQKVATNVSQRSKTIKEEDVRPSEDEDFTEVTYPEGGREAWLVVLGSFISMVASFGIMNTLGVIQAHLVKNQLHGEDEGKVGWIFGIYSFLSFFGGIIIGPLFDTYGPRRLLASGTISLLGGLVAFAFSKEYYQMALSFGILVGSGTSLIFTPAIASIGHFFLKRRAYATGVATTGGSIGGIIFPLALQSLFPKLGFQNAVLVLALICFVFLAVGNFLIRSRAILRSQSSAKIDIHAFKDLRFTLTAWGVFFIEWALFVPITYISSYTQSIGFSLEFSYQLLAILNVGSVFGRWLPGLVADRIGRFNTMVLTIMFCFISVIAFWLPTVPSISDVPHNTAKGLLVVWALTYGFASGTGISLTPVCVGQICETSEYGTKYGTLYFLVSFGPLTGVPIAGAILENMRLRREDGTVSDRWEGLVAFTAASYIGAWCMFLAARGIGGGWKWKKW